MAPLASRPQHLLPVQPTSRNSSNEDDKSPRPVAGPRGVLDQLVLPSRGDDAHLQDLLAGLHTKSAAAAPHRLFAPAAASATTAFGPGGVVRGRRRCRGS